MTISSAFTLIPSAPKAVIRLDWPGSFVALESSGKYETQVSVLQV